MASPSGPKWLDVEESPYSNESNATANEFFLVLICISLVACVAVTWRTQRCIPFSFVMCVAYIFEISAYALRFQAWDVMRYSAEVGFFTIAPVFITIGIHLSTAEVLTTLGPEHSPLSPNAHLRLFIWTDIVSLLLQGIGLGLTFSGARAAGPWGLLLAAQGHAGQTIVFIGLLVQTLSLAGALSLLAITYVKAGRADRTYGYTTFHRHRGGAPVPVSVPVPLSARFKIFLVVLPLAGVCVLVRCAYRSAAAWGGLGSAIARDEVLWLVAEGTLLTEAMVTLAVFHPAIWLNNNDASGRGSAHRHDVEGGGAIGVGVLGVGPKGKRLSSGTTLTMADTLDFGGGAAAVAARDSRHDLAETGHLMFSPNLIAPSEAGSSEHAGSRRGSDGSSVVGGDGRARVFQADPYYRYEDSQSPYDPAPVPMALFPARRYSADITAETRGLSPMEAEAEEDRLEVESFVLPPRKSSKRQSMMKRQVEADDQLEVESFVSPPRKSSKRKTTQDEDRLEVESIILPPRKPSKRDTSHGQEEDLDAVSLYSQ